MKIHNLTVRDAFTTEIDHYDDDRGYFKVLLAVPGWSITSSAPIPPPIQVNLSQSHKGVLRGIHVVPFAKVVHCVKGAILDVVVDMRKDSHTYLKYDAVELNEDNHLSVYVPPDCGHAFLATEDATVIYVQYALYDPKVEKIINYLEPRLGRQGMGIKWPAMDFILSDKDRTAPFIKSS